MSLAKKILRGSTLNLMDHVLQIVAMFIVTPFVVSKLGMESYGVWLMIIAMVSLLNFLDGSVTLSGTRFLAKSIGAGESEAETCNTLKKLYQSISWLMAAGTGILFFVIESFVPNESWSEGARWIVLALGSSMVVRFRLRVNLVILKSHLRYDLVVISSLVKLVVQTVLILVFLTMGYGLMTLAIIQILSDAVDQILVYFFSRKTATIDASVPYNPALLREICRYTGTSLLNTFAQLFRARLDIMIIARYCGVAWVPIYNIGVRLPQLMTDFVTAAMGGGLLAGLSHIQSRDGIEGVKKNFFRSLRVSVPLAVTGASAILLLGPSFLHRWLGPDFDDSAKVLNILVIPYALWHMQFPTTTLFLALNKHQKFAVANVTLGLLNALLSLVLVFTLGFLGVIWATCADLTILYGVIVPVLASQLLKVSTITYYRAMLDPLIRMLVVIIPALILLRPIVQPDYLRLALCAVVFGVIVLATIYFVVCNSEERGTLKKIASGVLGRIMRKPR